MIADKRDFRVRVVVEFDIDVPGASEGHAEAVARDITRQVFKESFGRAEALDISTLSSREL